VSKTPEPITVPTTADVATIARLSDAVVRNLQITQCYHELTTALATRIAGEANWCTFATWASKQAGQTIRGEDLQRALEQRFAQSPGLDAAVQAVAAQLRLLGAKRDLVGIRRAVENVLDTPAIFRRTSEAVATGNLKVFAEIGHEFARFLAECSGDAEFDAEKIERFCARLREGDPPDGQRYLRQAFSRYYQAMFEPITKRRTELLLFANLEVGFHEQTRLQPEILAALNAAVADPDQLTARVISAVFPLQAASILRVRRFFRRLVGGRTPLDLAVETMVDLARREIRLVLTDHLMTLGFPRGVVLKLGTDLRARFPASLTRIENTELTQLLSRIDPTPDQLRESGATDWADLPERLHYIADLFRCYHQSSELFDPPFDGVQVAALKAGKRP
jgi:hypothetical protein